MTKITEKIVNIKDKGAELEKEVREKTLGYIITSFGLVAGLAWNDAIKAFIERFFADPRNGIQAKFLYAMVMTIFVVAISLYLTRIFRVETKKDKEKKAAEEKEEIEIEKKKPKKAAKKK